jgi:hypothetical protein
MPPGKPPYSYSKVQLAWWTMIVLSSLITIIITKCKIPTLDSSTLILLGISAATSATARAIDVSNKKDPVIAQKSLSVHSDGLIIDILSDNDNVNMHRLQSVIINVTFGIYFIHAVLCNLNGCGCFYVEESLLAECRKHPIDFIIPIISTNNLVLLGLSSATYTALKSAENK